MSTAGIAAQEIQVSLQNGYLHGGQGLGSPKECWPGTNEFEDAYYDLDPLAMAFDLSPAAPQHIASFGGISKPFTVNGHCCAEKCMKVQCKKSSPLPLHLLPNCEEDQVVHSFKKLSVNGGSGSDMTPPSTPIKSGPLLFQAIVSQDRGCRPLPPLPISEDHSIDDADSEVEFLTSSETDHLLEDCRPLAFKYGVPSRRSFRGCGQINYAYFDSVTGSKKVDTSTPNQDGRVQNTKPQKPEQPNRRLRRSHSGPAGSYNKPARLSSHLNRASPNSDEDKPEVPPRIPIPPRPVKPDFRRWSAEVTSNTYSDEDRPPKVPPREPLSRSNSRTPSPKSLPLYLNGVMPPTQSFAPNPKYVSSKALQRQHSEGSTNKIPCILPIIENGKKASSTHYYLLPERPAYLHRYEKYLTGAEEASCDTKAQSWPNDCTTAATKLESKAKTDIANHVKCTHLSYVVSP